MNGRTPRNTAPSASIFYDTIQYQKIIIMANEEIAEKAKEMYESGMSMSEIAEELNVSKTTVHRMLHMTLGTSPNHYGTMDTKGNPAYHRIERPLQGGDNDLEFRLRQLELEHEHKMYELRNKGLELEIRKGESDKKEDRKKKEITRQGKVFLNRYLRLLKELRKDCEDTEWEEEGLGRTSGTGWQSLGMRWRTSSP